MTIQPIGKKVQLKIEKPTAGSLDLSSKATATEFGEVIAIGDEVKNLKVGDKIFFKSWQADVITHEGETYYFLDSEGEGICAYVR